MKIALSGIFILLVVLVQVLLSALTVAFRCPNPAYRSLQFLTVHKAIPRLYSASNDLILLEEQNSNSEDDARDLSESYRAPSFEIERRRNFAIISHPDAGKSTLTEKLLLFGGAIQDAGAVKARAGQRKVTSDWMEIEKQRGISVTSTVLSFQYSPKEQSKVLLDVPFQLNLLDTPVCLDLFLNLFLVL